MPYRRQHNCTLDETITENLVVVAKDTPIGLLQFVRGTRENGSTGIRAVRIPAEIPVNEGQRICQTMGGQFSPATPLNPRAQMMREKPCVSVVYALVKDFEMPTNEVRLSQWTQSQVDTLPDTSFAIILSGGIKTLTGFTLPKKLRLLPYKNFDGTINRWLLQNSISNIGLVEAPAEDKKEAFHKLLHLAKIYGIHLVEKPKFRLSDFEFYLDILIQAEMSEEKKSIGGIDV